MRAPRPLACPNANAPGHPGAFAILSPAPRSQGAAPKARSWGMALMAIPQANSHFFPIDGISELDDPRWMPRKSISISSGLSEVASASSRLMSPFS